MMFRRHEHTWERVWHEEVPFFTGRTAVVRVRHLEVYQCFKRRWPVGARCNRVGYPSHQG